MPIPSDWSQNLTAIVEKLMQKSERHELPGEEFIGDNPFHHFFVLDRVDSWDSFLQWVDELSGRWIFRGQREASWTFETSLDRAVKREEQTLTSYSMWHLDRKTAMKPLLYRFQQYAHTYLTHVPQMDDLSSWYALMQHHCAPTPLLDWTESAFVAMYFAVENQAVAKRKGETESYSAVWAIDCDWLDAREREVLHEKNLPFPEGNLSLKTIADYKNYLLGKEEVEVAPCVIRIDPALSNPRLFAQRGFFLCKLVEVASVAQLLMTMIFHPTLTTKPVIRKLEIANNFRIEFLKRLRAMNIHRASLFPGLEGLGSSLKLDLELQDTD